MMSNLSSAFRSTYDLAFQVSPIILVDGIASGTTGGMLPIIALVGQAASLVQGIATTRSLSTDDFFARYLPLPGSTLISNTIGTYPFANQQVAANAIIQQPLNISLNMIAPVKDTAGYLTKLAIFTSLQNSLNQHNNAGGSYHIATPAFLYTNCLMTAMTDITSGTTKQKQVEYQLDFVKPLVTQQQAALAYNSLMSKISGGSQVTSSGWSSASALAGSPAQGAASSITNAAGSVISYLSQPL